MRIISKIKAREKGLHLFWSGIPCRKGHKAHRYTISGRCIECSSDISQKQRDLDKDGLVSTGTGWPRIPKVSNLGELYKGRKYENYVMKYERFRTGGI